MSHVLRRAHLTNLDSLYGSPETQLQSLLRYPGLVRVAADMFVDALAALHIADEIGELVQTLRLIPIVRPGLDEDSTVFG